MLATRGPVTTDEGKEESIHPEGRASREARRWYRPLRRSWVRYFAWRGALVVTPTLATLCIALATYAFGLAGASFFRQRQFEAEESLARQLLTATRQSQELLTATALVRRYEFQVTLDYVSRPSGTWSPTITRQETALETPSPPEGQPPSTPTTDLYTPSGDCDDSSPPCIEYNAVSWDLLAVELYSEAGRCRWVEIANLNRRDDGTYDIPLPNLPVFVPAVAPRGTYLPRYRTANEAWSFFPGCSPTSGYPCALVVGKGITGNDLSAYEEASTKAYGFSTRLTAESIMDANRSSLCSGPVQLSEGVVLVIPSVLLDTSD